MLWFFRYFVHVRAILSLESGAYRCVFTLDDVLLRFSSRFPKIKGPLISLNLATSVILSSLSTLSPFTSAVTLPSLIFQ